MADFFDISSLDTKKQDYWQNRATNKLKTAFDTIKEAREMMMRTTSNHILEDDMEQSFQLAAKMVMETAKRVRKSDEVKTDE